ncbi:MAG: hypothetical protein ACFE0P_10465 [Oceanicaulis sp.]
MILDNLSRAIRTQNWLAAGIEFVIVIAGVVIGFQINAWAEARAAAAREAVLLDRLHDELEASVALLQRMTDGFEENGASRRRVIELMVAGQTEALAADDGAARMILSVNVLPAFSPRQGVYSEIVSSGMLSDLGDAELREALGVYQASIAYLQGQIDYMRWSHTAETSVTDFEFLTRTFAPGRGLDVDYTIDWRRALESPDFTQAVLENHASSLAMARWWGGTLDSARAACAETGRLTGRICGAGENP